MDDGDGELEMLMGMGFPKERWLVVLSCSISNQRSFCEVSKLSL